MLIKDYECCGLITQVFISCPPIHHISYRSINNIPSYCFNIQKVSIYQMPEKMFYTLCIGLRPIGNPMAKRHLYFWGISTITLYSPIACL